MVKFGKRMEEKVLDAIKRSAISDLERLRNDISTYIELLKKSDIDVEIDAILENAKRRANNFEFSEIEIRV